MSFFATTAPRAVARVAFCLLAATAAACGGSDVTSVVDGGNGGGGVPTSGQAGSFSATAGTASIGGLAVYATRNSVFAATLTDKDGKGQIVFGRNRATVPAVGTNAVGDGNEDATLFAGYTDLKTMQTYMSRAGSGTFTVSESSGGRLRGSFQLTLYSLTTSATITVSGSFDAQGL